MHAEPDLTRLAATVGDPRRIRMLALLMEGRALTAKELALAPASHRPPPPPTSDACSMTACWPAPRRGATNTSAWPPSRSRSWWSR